MIEKKAKISLKQRYINKLKKVYGSEKDMKYQGPLSYRYLRILAWIALAFTHIAMACAFCLKATDYSPINGGGRYFFSLFGNLSTPFFIIASFGLILSGNKSFKNFLIIYGGMFLGVALGFYFLYYRYFNGILVKLGASIEFIDLYRVMMHNKIEINVFTDLFIFTLFHFFVNYVPEKHFQDKKLIIFRLFALLPVFYMIASYILKVLSGLSYINLPTFFVPLMMSKSPLIFLLFAIVSLWIKMRQRRFKKLGFTKEEYQKFLKTKRNSFSFSLHLSIFIFIIVIIDLIFYIIIYNQYAWVAEASESLFRYILATYSAGDCIPLLLSIPFVMLYSYTKKHDDNTKNIDIIIPLGGLALIAVVYFECFYQIISALLRMAE